VGGVVVGVWSVRGPPPLKVFLIPFLQKNFHTLYKANFTVSLPKICVCATMLSCRYDIILKNES